MLYNRSATVIISRPVLSFSTIQYTISISFMSLCFPNHLCLSKILFCVDCIFNCSMSPSSKGQIHPKYFSLWYCHHWHYSKHVVSKYTRARIKWLSGIEYHFSSIKLGAFLWATCYIKRWHNAIRWLSIVSYINDDILP